MARASDRSCPGIGRSSFLRRLFTFFWRRQFGTTKTMWFLVNIFVKGIQSDVLSTSFSPGPRPVKNTAFVDRATFMSGSICVNNEKMHLSTDVF